MQEGGRAGMLAVVNKHVRQSRTINSAIYSVLTPPVCTQITNA